MSYLCKHEGISLCDDKIKFADIKVTLRTLKIHLSTMIENEQTFDAWKILKEAEATFDLVLDEDFFSLLVQELSLIGDVRSLE